MEEESKPSRRRVVGGLGAGLAVAAVTPVVGRPGAPGAVEPTAAKLADPTTKHPRPPFKVPSQPWPGRASHLPVRAFRSTARRA